MLQYRQIRTRLSRLSSSSMGPSKVGSRGPAKTHMPTRFWTLCRRRDSQDRSSHPLGAPLCSLMRFAASNAARGQISLYPEPMAATCMYTNAHHFGTPFLILLHTTFGTHDLSVEASLVSHGCAAFLFRRPQSRLKCNRDGHPRHAYRHG